MALAATDQLGNSEPDEETYLNSAKAISFEEWQETNHNKVICNGRIMCGVDLNMFIFTNISAIAITIAFYVTVYVKSPILCDLKCYCNLNFENCCCGKQIACIKCNSHYIDYFNRNLFIYCIIQR